jgi:FAD/FMN-containing dehydrogenase
VTSDPNRLASDHDYSTHVRDIDAPTPARFNADPHRLFEAAGSAGKVALMAVRLDTFPKTERAGVFYIGSNDPSELETIRRHMLARCKSLPISGEYLHSVAFDIAEKYGKDTFLAINYLGTGWLPAAVRDQGTFRWNLRTPVLSAKPSRRQDHAAGQFIFPAPFAEANEGISPALRAPPHPADGSMMASRKPLNI